MRKVLSLEGNYDFFSAKRVEDIVILNFKENFRKTHGKVWDECNILPGLSARLAVKLPTGAEDRAFGSGKPDWDSACYCRKI